MIKPSGHRALTRRLAAAAALAGVLATAACGGSDDPGASGSDSDGGGGSGAAITMTFALTGATTVKGEHRATPGSDDGPAAETCAAYAKGSKESHFVLPSLVNATVDGKKVFLGALVDPYAGPGTYRKKDLHDQGSPPGIDVDGKLYLMLTDSTSEVTVGPDGGGSWTFTGLVVRDADGTDGDDPVDGSVTWTCED
jgi:hypothetical protein